MRACECECLQAPITMNVICFDWQKLSWNRLSCWINKILRCKNFTTMQFGIASFFFPPFLSALHSSHLLFDLFESIDCIAWKWFASSSSFHVAYYDFFFFLLLKMSQDGREHENRNRIQFFSLLAHWTFLNWYPNARSTWIGWGWFCGKQKFFGSFNV